MYRVQEQIIFKGRIQATAKSQKEEETVIRVEATAGAKRRVLI